MNPGNGDYADAPEPLLRTVLRTLLACALLIGGWGLDWAPTTAAAAEAHGSCCCGMVPGPHDTCPCPKPEGPQGPSQNGCGARSTPLSSPLAVLQRATQGATRRFEPSPAPFAVLASGNSDEVEGAANGSRGRDPDLGRHLARLSTFRI